MFCFFVLLRKARLKIHNFTMRQILKKNLIQLIQRVRLWIKRLNSCQKLRKVCTQKVTLWNMSLGEKEFYCNFPAFPTSVNLKSKNYGLFQIFVLDFRKKGCIREITHWITLVHQTTYFAFFVFLSKACL